MLLDPPPKPYNERAARDVLEQMKHYFGRNVDLDEQAYEWRDIGGPTVSKAEARRRVASRLADPSVAARLCPGGRVPQIDPADVGDAAQPSPYANVEEELRASGKYSF